MIFVNHQVILLLYQCSITILIKYHAILLLYHSEITIFVNIVHSTLCASLTLFFKSGVIFCSFLVTLWSQLWHYFGFSLAVTNDFTADGIVEQIGDNVFVSGVNWVLFRCRNRLTGSFVLQLCCRKVAEESWSVAWSVQSLPSTSHHEHAKVPRGILQCESR